MTEIQLEVLELAIPLIEAIRKVAEEAKKLKDSGYDGPFMGEDIVPLFTAINEWEILLKETNE